MAWLGFIIGTAHAADNQCKVKLNDKKTVILTREEAEKCEGLLIKHGILPDPKDPISNWDKRYFPDRLDTLDPLIQTAVEMFFEEAQRVLGEELEIEGAYKLRLVSANRSDEEQLFEYKKGRKVDKDGDLVDKDGNKIDIIQEGWKKKVVDDKTNGDIVTYAGPGESNHNYGFAIDIARVDKNAKDIYDIKWEKLEEIGKKYGFEWGGNWKSRDKAHFQNTFGYDEKVFRAFMLDPNQEELNKEYQKKLLDEWDKKKKKGK